MTLNHLNFYALDRKRSKERKKVQVYCNGTIDGRLSWRIRVQVKYPLQWFWPNPPWKGFGFFSHWYLQATKVGLWVQNGIVWNIYESRQKIKKSEKRKRTNKTVIRKTIGIFLLNKDTSNFTPNFFIDTKTRFVNGSTITQYKSSTLKLLLLIS